MHSDLIGKIEKARRYAQEPERVTIQNLNARFRGGNDHDIRLENGDWSCDCHFFGRWQTCSHVMALQRVLEPMLSEDARRAGSPFSFNEEIAEAVG